MGLSQFKDFLGSSDYLFINGFPLAYWIASLENSFSLNNTFFVFMGVNLLIIQLVNRENILLKQKRLEEIKQKMSIEDLNKNIKPYLPFIILSGIYLILSIIMLFLRPIKDYKIELSLILILYSFIFYKILYIKTNPKHYEKIKSLNKAVK
jgi:hypothetical protein